MTIKEPLPEPEIPSLARAVWQLYELVTWPYWTRQLRRAGFRRTGWMTWEAGPDDAPAAVTWERDDA